MTDLHAVRWRRSSKSCSTRLKQFRALATRYTKRAANYRALIVLAALLIRLRGIH